MWLGVGLYGRPWGWDGLVVQLHPTSSGDLRRATIKAVSAFIHSCPHPAGDHKGTPHHHRRPYGFKDLRILGLLLVFRSFHFFISLLLQ